MNVSTRPAFSAGQPGAGTNTPFAPAAPPDPDAVNVFNQVTNRVAHKRPCSLRPSPLKCTPRPPPSRQRSPNASVSGPCIASPDSHNDACARRMSSEPRSSGV